MGVHGLWQLLQPAGRPVSLESLEGKILAVDVSIWLHQTMKGMRDKDGNPLPNAHLQGLFSRVCKLLFYRIKPVFVFDGGVPVLKKQTMAARRERKVEAERESSDMAQKLLRNLIQSEAVKQALGDTSSPPKRVPGVRKGRNKQESDLFELAPLPESEQTGLALNAEEWDQEFERQENWIKEGLAALSDTRPDSEEFKALPMEIQHEILSELKEQRKYHSLSRLTKMPEDSDDFSSYQLKKLMKQSRLTTRIEEVRKEMSSKTAGDITYSLGDDYYGDEIEARRIVSEDASHYVLIKGLTKKKQEEEALKYEIQNLVKKEENDDDDAYGGFSGRETKQDEESTDLKAKHGKIYSTDSDSDVEVIMARRMRRKRGQNRKSSRKAITEKTAGKKGNISSKKRRILSSDDDEEMEGTTGAMVVEDEEEVTQPTSHSSSEDEGFIEVTVDPSAPVEEDDLFPASMFATTSQSVDVTPSKQSLMSAGKELSEPTAQSLTGKKEVKRNGKTDVSQADDTAMAEKQRGLKTSTPGLDENASKRKTMLSDILLQLEEKKKKLNESLAEEDIEVVAKDTEDKDLRQETLSEDDTEMAAKETDEDFSQSGGFFREDSDEDEEIVIEKSVNMMKQDMTSSEPSVTRQVTDTTAENKQSTTDGVEVLSDSDEDLRLAIELSLQTAKEDKGQPEKNEIAKSKSSKKTDMKQAPVMSSHMKTRDLPSEVDDKSSSLKFQSQKTMNELSENSNSSEEDNQESDFEEVAPFILTVETASTSTAQQGNSFLKDNRTNTASDVEIAGSPPNVQEDQNASTSSIRVRDVVASVSSASESVRSVDKLAQDNTLQEDKDAENLIPAQVTATSPGGSSPLKSSQDRMQPEDFEMDDEADVYFRTLNECDLMDMNQELANEKKALLLERGRQTRMATSVTEQTNLDAQELLRMFGIPFIVSPMEAEAQCAYLDNTGQTQGTITDDSDFWLFGGRRMYKNFFNQSKHVEYFTVDNIKNHFGLSREQLINIALLCGSDYTEGIQGVGPVRALEIMAEFPGEGLEGLYVFRQWWDKAKKMPGKIAENKIRNRLKELSVIPGFPSQAVVDAYLNPTVDESTETFSWGFPDLDLLRDFAKYKFGWPKDKTDQSLLPMMKQLNKTQSQGRIHAYFQPENFVKTSQIKSQRLRKALTLVSGSVPATELDDGQGSVPATELDDGQGSEDLTGQKEKSAEATSVTNESTVKPSQKRKTDNSITDSEKAVNNSGKKFTTKTEISSTQEDVVVKDKAGKSKSLKKLGKIAESSKKNDNKADTNEKTKSSKKVRFSDKVGDANLGDVLSVDTIGQMSIEVDALEKEPEKNKVIGTGKQADDVISETDIKVEIEKDDSFMEMMLEKVKQACAQLKNIPDKRGGQGVGGRRGGGRGKRGSGRGKGVAGGRGHGLPSLDQRLRPRKGRGTKVRRGGHSFAGQGVVNLSESSSSNSSNDESDDDEADNNHKNSLACSNSMVKSQNVEPKIKGSVRAKKKLPVDPGLVETLPSEPKMDTVDRSERTSTKGSGVSNQNAGMKEKSMASKHQKPQKKETVPVDSQASTIEVHSGAITKVRPASRREDLSDKRDSANSQKTETAIAEKVKVPKNVSSLKESSVALDTTDNTVGVDTNANRNANVGRETAPRSEQVAKSRDKIATSQKEDTGKKKETRQKKETRNEEFVPSSHTTRSTPQETIQKIEQMKEAEPQKEEEPEEEIDIRKADVSIINKQNLPSTLTYLNQRSREDKFLLHQLRGSKVMNAVEKRLAESEKRTWFEKKKEIPKKVTEPQEILSFEDMLGGMDAAMEKSQKKSKRVHSEKLVLTAKTASANRKEILSQVKSMRDRIVKQMTDVGSVVTDTSKTALPKKDRPQKIFLSNRDNNKSPPEVQQKSNHSKESLKEKGSNRIANKKDKKTKEKKVGFASSDESSEFSELSPPSQRRRSSSTEDAGSLKTKRSLQFDAPIGEDDDEGDFGMKQSRKVKRFQKQMEHLHDSKSVKGHGILPLDGGAAMMRGRAFAGKGKGIGKNRRNTEERNVDNQLSSARSTQVQVSKNVSETEIKDYEDMTIDDLGSDFSDFEM